MAEINKITKNYRTQKRLSLRDFADVINEKLINTSVTYATVNRWEDEVGYYEPDLRLLFECIVTYHDWRAVWAVECMTAMFPDLFMTGVIRIELPRAE